MAHDKGITQFYLPPARLSTNVMSHPAFTPSRTASPYFGLWPILISRRTNGRTGNEYCSKCGVAVL